MDYTLIYDTLLSTSVYNISDSIILTVTDAESPRCCCQLYKMHRIYTRIALRVEIQYNVPGVHCTLTHCLGQDTYITTSTTVYNVCLGPPC